MPRIIWKEPPEKPGEEIGVTIFDEGEITYENAQPENFTPMHPEVASLISDPNHEKMVTDKHTFQVGNTLYEEDLPTLQSIHSLPN